MNVQEFIDVYRKTFGKSPYLPMVYFYSEQPIGLTEKMEGCFFKWFDRILQGTPVSLTGESIGCGGGKFYTGFTEMPERVPRFVSLQERYKKSPEMVTDAIQKMSIQRAGATYLNIARVDQVTTFDHIEGMIFLATPDVLSGLCGWAFYDSTTEDAVTTIFGSGCSTMFANVTTENRRNGHRCFLGLFDPSVRPHVDAQCLGFGIPKSRLVNMMGTMEECFLGNSSAWNKVRERINDNPKSKPQ